MTAQTLQTAISTAWQSAVGGTKRIRGGSLGMGILALSAIAPSLGEEVPLSVAVSKSAKGTMEVTVAGRPDHYYMLYRSPHLDDPGEVAAMALGVEGPVILKDRFAPKRTEMYYRVREIRGVDSEDTDGDGRSDYGELRANLFRPDRPNGNAFNPVDKLRNMEGTDLLTFEDFVNFSVDSRIAGGISEELPGDRFMKFIGLPMSDTRHGILFINSHRHLGHGPFLAYMAGQGLRPRFVQDGEIGWLADAEGGGDGWYVFDLQGQLMSFKEIREIYHSLTKNMPFIDGNLVYRPWGSSLALYWNSAHLRDQLRREGIPVWLDGGELDVETSSFTPLNEGETFGLLRVFDGDERPSLLDVAIFRSLPNDVPLIRGIITESPQTPLSHVNLRAIQNHNPNAFISGASTRPEIAPLIGRYVRYAVRADGFEIEEASQEEVNAYLAALRPVESQEPPRDTEGNRSIKSLEVLGFEDSVSVGVKAANLAEMISSETINLPRDLFPPVGYAVPFYFYDVFMRHNDFYQAAEVMMSSEGFADSVAIREAALRDFRKRIRKGAMPDWMLNALTDVQQVMTNPEGIRCRSSTNNEDLPGFNGAGLYESYTHHLDEGHLSKSIKQVYAGLWTLIAFEHREFYRVDHSKAAMGVLMHQAYQDEKANGVAVSRYDLIPEVGANPFYANVQVGENLVTNPELDSRPEELLLPNPYYTRSFNNATSGRAIRLASSNQVPPGTELLSDAQATLLGSYLWSIAKHFQRLYKASDDLAMEIEFKITSEDRLIIKQARPWLN